MAADERAEEQQFLAELKARSGRDLAEWMSAISAQGFADKNETIDWLRSQGFPFARASWLERIHSNGGRPIYDDKPERPVRPPAKARSQQAGGPQAPLPPAPPPALAAPSPQPATAIAASDEHLQLEKLIAAAKGYRPLYVLLESEIRRTVPGASPAPAGTYISFRAPNEFAAVTLHASEVRLGLDLGERPFDGHVQRAKLKGPAAPITHMVVLTDARQVNADLMALVLAANARANG